MSIQTKIECPDCHSPIILDSLLLIAGQQFRCSNPNCGCAVQLAEDERSKVADAYQKFEQLKQNSLSQAQAMQE